MDEESQLPRHLGRGLPAPPPDATCYEPGREPITPDSASPVPGATPVDHTCIPRAVGNADRQILLHPYPPGLVLGGERGAIRAGTAGCADRGCTAGCMPYEPAIAWYCVRPGRLITAHLLYSLVKLKHAHESRFSVLYLCSNLPRGSIRFLPATHYGEMRRQS